MFQKIDIISLVAIVYMGIIYLVMIPSILYSLYYFHSKVKGDEIMQLFMQNRPTQILYSINIIIAFALCTDRLYICLTQIWPSLISVPQWTVYMFISVSYVTSINLFATKAYYFYYIREYNAFIADKIWVSTINKSNAENNWFIQNKYRFGNINYLLKLNIIPSCLFVLIITIISSYYSDNLFVFITLYSIICLIPMLISFIVLCKINRHEYDDIYGMKNEIAYQSISLLIGIILSFIGGIITAYDYRLFWTVQIYISLIITCSLTFISILYSIYYYKQQKKLLHDKTKSFSTLIQFKLGDLTNSDQIVIADMEAVISKYEPFKNFMSYLVTEFSTESLAFLVELIQIKYEFQVENNYLIRVPKQNKVKAIYYLNDEKIYKTKINSYSSHDTVTEICSLMTENSNNNNNIINEDDKNDNTKYMTLDFNVTEKDKNNESVRYTFLFHRNNSLTKLSIPGKLTESEILTKSNNNNNDNNNDNNNNNLCYHMIGLYHKYIKVGSTYELNISCQSREALQLFFECKHDAIDSLNYYMKKKEYFQVFNVFDEIGLEIVWLLQASFQRFEQSSQFDRKLMYNLRKPENEIYPETRNACSYMKLKERYSNSINSHI